MTEKNDTPSAIKLVEQQEIAAREAGFYWESIHQLLAQIRSECTEIEEAWQQHDRTHLQEEVGDLLQAAIGLAVFCGFDSEKTLHKSAEKFQQRFDAVRQIAAEEGFSDLHSLSVQELLGYWERSKERLKPSLD